MKNALKEYGIFMHYLGSVRSSLGVSSVTASGNQVDVYLVNPNNLLVKVMVSKNRFSTFCQTFDNPKDALTHIENELNRYNNE